jgi:hypothetical protein
VALSSRAAADTLHYTGLWRGFARLHKAGVALPARARSKSFASMSDCNEELTQSDEEIILRDEVSDEVLEAASVARGGLSTLLYGTYCFACPSRPTIRSQVAAKTRREGLR